MPIYKKKIVICLQLETAVRNDIYSVGKIKVVVFFTILTTVLKPQEIIVLQVLLETGTCFIARCQLHI